MSEGRTEVDITALRSIGGDLIKAAENLRTDAAEVLPGLAEDPEARWRSYAADERNVPGQLVSRSHEEAVESVTALLGNLAAALESLGQAADLAATDFSQTDSDIGVDVDSVDSEVVDIAIPQNRG